MTPPLRRSLAPLAVAAALLLGCTTPEATPTPRPTLAGVTPSATATGSASATPTPTSTAPAEATAPQVTPKPSPTGTPEPPALTGDIIGWFTEPRPASNVATRTIGVPPPSPFPPYDRQSAEVVLYDVETMTERRLGLGGYASFSPDGTMLAWVTGPEAHRWEELRLLDLRTGEERGLGRARTAQWLGNETIAVYEQGNDRAVVDVVTGAHGPERTGDDPPRPPEIGGYLLQGLSYPPDIFRSHYRLIRADDGSGFLFDAYRAVLAPDGRLFLATVPEPAARSQPNPGGPNVGLVETNLFEVDPATRLATFIATTRASFPNWPFAAGADVVVWQQNACTQSATTHLLDRRTGARTEVRGPIEWPYAVTPAGLIASGAFGAKALIDPATLDYRVVLPDGLVDVAWSRDFRYAAVGAALGHGGLCGG
ncbi:MAG: hypothetical protein AB7G21_11290 [Dehalococcoidia bacterium]